MVSDSTDPAVARARAVVGMYGDPTVSWSIGVDVSLRAPGDRAALDDRCRTLVDEHSHLGRRPGVDTFEMGAAGDVLASMLDTPYGNADPLVRVALDREGSRLILTGHHGALDGLGLLAVLSVLLGHPVETNARGIGFSATSRGFGRSSVTRLAEVLLRPPDRVARPSGPGVREPGVTRRGDVTARRDVATVRLDTARLVATTALVVREWNSRHGTRARRIVAGIGASCREGSKARPDRDTAYLRIRVPHPPSEEVVRDVIAKASPEPSFPERQPGAWAGLVLRALRPRLGSTVLVSNLGLVESSAVERIALYPSAAGPQALAVGVLSTSSYTTVTVRMPRVDFPQQAADDLCGCIVERLSR